MQGDLVQLPGFAGVFSGGSDHHRAPAGCRAGQDLHQHPSQDVVSLLGGVSPRRPGPPGLRETEGASGPTPGSRRLGRRVHSSSGEGRSTGGWAEDRAGWPIGPPFVPLIVGLLLFVIPTVH